jgi:hypothetical protein
MKHIFTLIIILFLASCTINIGTNNDDPNHTEDVDNPPEPDDSEQGKLPKGVTPRKEVVLGLGKSLSFSPPVGYRTLPPEERKEMHNKGVEAMGGTIPIINPLIYAAKKDGANSLLITSNLSFAKDVAQKKQKLNEVLRGAADTYEAMGMEIETSTSRETFNNQVYRKKSIRLFKGVNREKVLTQDLYVAYIGNYLVNITASYDNNTDKETLYHVLKTLRVETNKKQPLTRNQ